MTKRILVVGPSWVGDMVMAQSLFKTLRKNNPEVLIDVLAPAWSAPILGRMPEVAQQIDMPVGHGQLDLRARYQLGRSLRHKAYDQAIVIPRSFKAALIPFFAKIPRRTGFRGEMRYGLLNDIYTLDKSILSQTVQRYVALGLDERRPVAAPQVPYPHLRIDLDNQKKLIQQFGLSSDRPMLGFMPAAEYGEAKRWPPEYFAALAKKLIESGRQIVLFGGKKDKAICQGVAAGNGAHIVDLSGQTHLQDVVDLLAMMELVVSNDSGLMHVAAATGRRIVAIYGSSTPQYTPPLTDKAEICYLALECSPCFKRQCPKGHTRCLRDISVEDVFKRCQAASVSF